METFSSTAEFLAWRERYPNAWVVNFVGNKEVLHQAKCSHLDEFTHHPEYDLVANPKFAFYMRDRVTMYRPNARPCPDCC